MTVTPVQRLTLGLSSGLLCAAAFAWQISTNQPGGMLPHGYCFTWNPTLLTMHVASDALIGFAYAVISLTLLHLVRRRGDLRFNAIVTLFAMFILFCGATHWMDVWTVWFPNYWASGWLKVATALVSLLTAVTLILLVPIALAMPTVADMELAKTTLEAEVLTGRSHLADAERMRAIAEDASRAKSDFLATVSHEIRTPMNGILGTAELLTRSPLLPDQEQLATTLLRSGRMLMGILDDILDLSKIEANELRLHEAPFSPRLVLAEVYELFAAYAQAKGLSFSTTASPAVPFAVLGDGQRVRQVLGNLVNNAIKFSSTGAVCIRIKQRPTQRPESALLRFEVEDSGIGIENEARSRVLQPFVQADSSVGRRFGGTGLGLTICQRLVSMMGGVIDFQSTPGSGSCFWFEVELLLSSPSETFHAEHADANASAHSNVATMEEPRPTPSATDGKRKAAHLLVVEDNHVNAMIVEAQLAYLNCSCDIAADGDEALLCLQRSSYAAVLMDWMLPGLSGDQVARAWRNYETEHGLARTPIIALTANALASNVETARRAGMDEFVTKPCTVTKLSAVVARWTRAADAT